MISALPFLLMIGAPAAANDAEVAQRPAAPKVVRAQATILRAAIISPAPPKDGIAETDREYHRRRLVPMVEFY